MPFLEPILGYYEAPAAATEQTSGNMCPTTMAQVGHEHMIIEHQSSVMKHADMLRTVLPIEAGLVMFGNPNVPAYDYNSL